MQLTYDNGGLIGLQIVKMYLVRIGEKLEEI